jgi:hypothetical protein
MPRQGDMQISRRVYFAAITGLLGFLLLVGLERMMRPRAVDGLYFQSWSSEAFMQTVPIQNLRDAPLETLLNIHIQPPAFDALRAVLVRFAPGPGIQTQLKQVDHRIYYVWAVVYAVLGSLLFLWIHDLTTAWFAFPAALLFLLHPASILYATLLDTTLLTAVLILWTYYLLWQSRADPRAPVGWLIVSVLALFFTRSLFQWPFVLVFALCLWLLGVARRKVLTFVLITGIVAGLWVAKQYAQFGLLSTSSLTGINLSRSVGILDRENRRVDRQAHEFSGQPEVLQNRWKTGHRVNLNHSSYLDLNQRLMDRYQAYMLSAPVGDLTRAYLFNLHLYLRPSSAYEDNVIVSWLPWRSVYDSIFSFPVLPGLLLVAGILMLLRMFRERTYRSTAALLIPAALILLISVVSERGENHRFKFFLEPVLYVFILNQLWQLGVQLRRRAHGAHPLRSGWV